MVLLISESWIDAPRWAQRLPKRKKVKKKKKRKRNGLSYILVREKKAKVQKNNVVVYHFFKKRGSYLKDHVINFFIALKEIKTIYKTNYHKFMILHFWRSEVQKEFHWAEIKVASGIFLLENLGKSPIIGFVQLPEFAQNPWFVACYQSNSCFYHYISLSNFSASFSHLLRVFMIILNLPR